MIQLKGKCARPPAGHGGKGLQWRRAYPWGASIRAIQLIATVTKLEPNVITELWGWEWREAEKVQALLLGQEFTLQRMTRRERKGGGFWQKEERECRGVKVRMAFWKFAISSLWISLGSVR